MSSPIGSTDSSVELDTDAVATVTPRDHTDIAAFIKMAVVTVGRCYRGETVELRTYLSVVEAARQLGLPEPPKVVRVRYHARPRNTAAPSSIYTSPELSARSR